MLVPPVRLPLWAIPGLAAIVLTTGSVAAAEGTFSSSKVALPQEVQLHVPGKGTVPVPTMTTTTSEPPGSSPTDQVVAPSRPVVTQSGPSSATRDAVVPGAMPTSPPATVGTPNPDPGAESDDGAASPPVSPATTLPPLPGVGTPTTTTTTTMPAAPPTTTTTTTRPRWGGGGGDE